MKRKSVLIIGAGGHAKVLAELISMQGIYSIAGFIDDKIKAGTIIFQNKKVLADAKNIDKLEGKAEYFIAAVGNNTLREEFFDAAVKYFKPLTLIHPFSFIAESAKVGVGTVVLAGAVISSNAVIGKNTIINSHVLIDHDSVVGDHCHIAQGTVVGSNVYFSSRKFTEISSAYPSFSKV